eukprot:g1081.t1
MWFIIVFVCVAVSGFSASPVSRIKVDRDTHFFVDEDGRARFFHGVNAVEKIPPFHPVLDGFDPVRSLSPIDAANLARWGFNVVRLGVMWQAVVPDATGQVNATFLASVARIVRTLADAGIYTLVDMHQDVMGGRFCGEGLANWTVAAVMAAADASGAFNSSDPRTRFAAPLASAAAMQIDPVTQLPSRAACAKHTFSDYYSTHEVLAAFDALFATPALWELFGEHWHAVASALGGTAGLLGYELINEPWGNATLLRPSSDRARLLPLYTRLHERIREADNDTCLFYEPHVLNAQYGHATDFPEGGPGGPEYNDRQVLSYHIYCLDTLPVPHVSCAAAYDLGWGAVAKSLRATNGGGFLTEFGAVSQSDLDLELITSMLDPADAHMQSWAYWNFKSFDDITTTGKADGGESFYNRDGSLQQGKLRALTRAYARAVAGVPTKTAFENSTGDEVFTLEFAVARPGTVSAGARTEIFAHRALHYPDGVDVAITPPGAAAWAWAATGTGAAGTANAADIIEVALNASAVAPGDIVRVVVRRKVTCRCAPSTSNPNGCCVPCKPPFHTCGGGPRKRGEGNWCGNDFHAAYCSEALPVCCTSNTGASVCCPAGNQCKSGLVKNECMLPFQDLSY